jgi:ABC-2 type transport system permease protein
MVSATVPRVRVPERSATSELRAIRVVWEREVVRFASDRLRMITSLFQPLLFLFVLGTGLSRIASSGTGGLNLRTFLFPGILAMAVLFTAMFSAASIVWDREFGFLREMLVICLAGLVGVPYSPSLILGVFVMQVLLAYALTAFGVMVAARIKQIQSFMALTQMLVMPLFFVSGAMFPLTGLPTWLAVLNRRDPLTYAVDPIRRIVFDHLSLTPEVRRRLDPGVTWGGWHVTPVVCALVVLAIGVVMTAIAIAQFNRTD